MSVSQACNKLYNDLYIYERLQNGKITANNYDVIRIMFQDLAIDSGYFIQDFILDDNGSTYTEGSIRYANNSIYVLQYQLNFSNHIITINNSHYSACVSNACLDCNSPRILYIWGLKNIHNFIFITVTL